MSTLAAARPDLPRQQLENLRFRYLIERGGQDRYGPDWLTPERAERIDYELSVIEPAGFAAAFVMLAGIMDFCRAESIPYGPGRGSVGGCYTGYLAGIHEVDSIEWGLDFERFMNPERVSFPDVDLDFSQRDRDRVLKHIYETYNRDGQIVLQIGAFVRAGARAVVDLMLAAKARFDENAGATATNLKKCLPEGNVTGGVKVPRELAWWLENGHGDKAQFRFLAEQAGWLEPMLKLDGMFTHLGKHAAGVVILDQADLSYLPTAVTVGAKGETRTVTAYDMYSLDDLKYLKWDILGLRTLDIIVDAHKLAGGSGKMRDLLKIWQQHRDDPEPYELLQAGDTTGVFQMETPGYQRTLREFQPDCFDHIVQLVALYRPGALDYVRPDDGKNMVEVFIDRRHGREVADYIHPLLEPVLQDTHGIMLYQEQMMKAARAIAGFTGAQADELRRAIGKKKPKEMAVLLKLLREGALTRGVPEGIVDRVEQNLKAAARYSWNKSHAVECGIITWWTAWFKSERPLCDKPCCAGMHDFGPAPFYCALINSWEEKKERQVSVVAEARQTIEFLPPDVNLADDSFTVVDGKIVFGLNGIKGMGEANRNAILLERMLGGPYTSYFDLCRRLPSVPTNMKKSLVACGAFDSLEEDRHQLLAEIPKGDPSWMWHLSCGCTSRKARPSGEAWGNTRCAKCKQNVTVLECTLVERKRQLVLEQVNDNAKRDLEGKEPKPRPPAEEWVYPSDTQIAQGELDAMGYYITAAPLKDVMVDLGRTGPSCVGGEVTKIRRHNDKNGNEMATLEITTPDLTSLRVRIFQSDWAVIQHRVEKGKKLIFRGRMDGGTWLASHCWEPGDYRHFKKYKISRDGGTETVTFQPDLSRSQRLAAVSQAEDAGYRVRLL